MSVSTKKRTLLFSLAGVVLVATGLTVSTQYVASRLGYHRHLSTPLTKIIGRPVYAPWAWLQWDDGLHRFAPRVFATAGFITYGTLVAVLGPLVALAFLTGRRARASTSHGSARWSDRTSYRSEHARPQE